MSSADKINMGYYHNIYLNTYIFQIKSLKALLYNQIDLFFGKHDISGIYIYTGKVKNNERERRMLSM